MRQESQTSHLKTTTQMRDHYTRANVVTEPQVLQALSHIVDPDLGRDVVSLGMIKEMTIEPAGRVAFTFELTTPACPVKDRFKQQAQEIVSALPGVTVVDVKMTANVRSSAMRPQAAQMLPGVRQVIAVASGKGGVGKSTVAVNLAAALARSGARVGLLDADIYGPSVPGMTGVDAQPQMVDVARADGSGETDRRLLPLEAHGLKLMSIGFIGNAEQAMVWRGPMVSRAIQQLMSDVEWGELDYLVVDLPPGTGDASLTIAQSVPLGGVVIVSTPQDVALGIAVKALQMFRQLNVNPVGLVENMSYFVCPDCGSRHAIFGEGGTAAAAERLGVPYLGAVPLEPALATDSDDGVPIVLSRPDSESARAFTDLAQKVAARVSVQSFRKLPVLNVS